MKISIAKIWSDVLGGFTTAAVVYPAALAFGIASGLGPLAGLYSAVAIGICAVLFDSTRTMVSGPTAPMTVAMAIIVSINADSLSTAFATVFLAGVFQILFGCIRVGRFIAYTPHSVISGFMSGIGVILIAINVMPILGYPSNPNGLVNAIILLPDALKTLNTDALVLGALTFIVILIWPRRFAKFIPAMLFALLLGTAAGIYWFRDAPVVGSVDIEIFAFTFPMLEFEKIHHVFEHAFLLALIGSLNTLLTALVSDSMTSGVHKPNRELVGQGLGNSIAGTIGGLPGSGSIVFTVANIRAGGRTRLSIFLVSVIILFAVLGFGGLAEPIPSAVLAAILITVGWDLIDVQFLANIRKIKRAHAFVMLLTLFVTVFVDLLTGVAIGLIVSSLATAVKAEVIELDNVLSVPLLDLEGEEPFAAPIGYVRLTGTFSVASASSLVRVINADIEDHDVVIFDFGPTVAVDDSAAIIIRQLIETAVNRNTPCLAIGLSESIKKDLAGFRALRLIPESLRFETLDEARHHAHLLLEELDAK